jgi:hypothetical protein
VSIPKPPADAAELAEFPRLVWTANQPLVRIHRELNEPAWFSADGSGRFDPPPARRDAFGTCYLATHPLGAFVETFGRIRPIRQDLLDERVVSTVFTPSDVSLANLTNAALIGKFGLSAELGIAADYDTCQLWAERLFEAGFAGVYYAARHDPALDSRSVALFGKPGLHADQVLVADTRAIPRELVEQATERFGFQVLPATTIL